MEIKRKLEKFIETRPHSRKEFLDYLRFRCKLEEETVEELILDLTAHGYVDDVAFTKWYLGDRVTFSKYGWQRIKEELLSKGVSVDIVEESAEMYGRSEIVDLDSEKLTMAVDKLLSSYRGNYEGLVWQKEKMKIVRKMVGRGFSYEDVERYLASKRRSAIISR